MTKVEVYGCGIKWTNRLNLSTLAQGNNAVR